MHARHAILDVFLGATLHGAANEQLFHSFSPLCLVSFFAELDPSVESFENETYTDQSVIPPGSADFNADICQ
jgi:hypothetical protein